MTDERDLADRYAAFEAVIKDAAAAWLRERNVTTRPSSPFCAAEKEDWTEGLIDRRFAELVRLPRSEWHQWIHSGKSSQAMAVNLFGVYLATGSVGRAATALGDANYDDTPRLVFEHSDRSVLSETGRGPTSVDVAIFPGRRSANRPLFVEVKLTERGFGNCSKAGTAPCDGGNPTTDFSKCYLHAIAGRTYWDRLRQFGALQSEAFRDPVCPLIPDYQFYRMACFALAAGGDFVLVADERNPYFGKPGPKSHFATLAEAFPPEHRGRLRYVSVQSLLTVAETFAPDVTSLFRRRYGMEDAA